MRCAGSPISAWPASRPRLLPNGEIVEWFGTAQDVTIHKKVEEPHKKASYDVKGG